MGGHTWLWASKDEKQAQQDTVTVPVVVGITVVLLTFIVLYILHKRPSIAGRTGTHTTLEGGKLVRRSGRPRKGVSRWSPDDLGTPTGMKDERKEGGSFVASMTPTQLIKKAKEELPSPPSLTPPTTAKRASTRKTAAASPVSPPSPPRTRRATASTPGRRH